MSKVKNIDHRGRVESINSDKIRVRFLARSACASCHAKGVCSASDMEEKYVDVVPAINQSFEIGEEVQVSLQQSLGLAAVMYGYVLPFVIVLLALILFSSIFASELYAGLGALILLIPYYMILFISRKKISKSFSFRIQKLV